MPTDLLTAMIPYFGCVFMRTEVGLVLTGAGENFMNSAAVTTKAWRAPFRVKAVAKTNSTNLRLYWHLGEIILNWECSVRELRVHDPATGKQRGLKERGFISADQWHEVVWEIALDSMKLVVDGETRFETAGEYGHIEAALGIGPCFGSTVTVQSFSVEQG